MGVAKDPFYKIRNGNTIFENFTAIFGILVCAVLKYQF